MQPTSARTFDMLPTRRPGLRVGLLVAAFLAAAAASGCASGKSGKRSDDSANRGNIENPEGPTPEELAEHPCGNPDWGTLPDQHQVDGDTGEGETSDESSPQTGGAGDDASSTNE
ncbi:MAG: hypothetical protein ABEL76_03030 [Bradymonadaceae bacterium]